MPGVGRTQGHVFLDVKGKITMSTDTNKRLVRRHYEEVLSGKNLSVIDEIYGEKIKIGDTAEMPRDQFKAYAQISTMAFPDLKVTVWDQIAEGDRVVSRWTATGTHKGQFLDIAPTGRTVEISAIHIHQIQNNRIITLWEEIDLLGLRRQLGA
jgi:steroid delta-isomerase-like uncharacterized protein